MKLLIISHTPHYLKEGKPAGWTATVREIDRLAGLFEKIVHVAPLYKENLGESAAFYQASNVTLRPVKPSGGKTFISKFGVLLRVPEYVSVILEELKKCDAVHVRCPSGISLAALFVLTWVKYPQKRWIKYAGDWRGYAREARSYKIQRYILQKNYPHAAVTVNGRWPAQPPHIQSFLNPCLTEEDIRQGKTAAAAKKILPSLKLLFVGRVEEEKGIGTALQILACLSDKHRAASLDIVGDGPERKFFEKQAAGLNLQNVRFHGWLSREKLNLLYEGSHFILLPTLASEGWPKVLSEAMAFGTIPLAAETGSIPQYLKNFGCGKCLSPKNPESWAREIIGYAEKPAMFDSEVLKAVKAAEEFTYAIYLNKVKKVLDI